MIVIYTVFLLKHPSNKYICTISHFLCSNIQWIHPYAKQGVHERALQLQISAVQKHGEIRLWCSKYHKNRLFGVFFLWISLSISNTCMCVLCSLKTETTNRSVPSLDLGEYYISDEFYNFKIILKVFSKVYLPLNRTFLHLRWIVREKWYFPFCDVTIDCIRSRGVLVLLKFD